MIDSVPDCAAFTPPETGQSSMSMPCSARRAAKPRVAAAEIVPWSITMVPGVALSTTPPGPNSTCSTSAVAVTLVNTTAAPSAASAGVLQADAPRAAKGCIASARRA